MSECYCASGGGPPVACGGGGQRACGTNDPGYYNATSGIQLCCTPSDECGANSICRFDPSAPGHPSTGSGFYYGGCTDPTFQDPLCRNDCQSRLYLPTCDIVYVPSLGVWSCCGRGASGAVDCSVPLTQYSFKTSWTPNVFPGPLQNKLEPALTTTPGISVAGTTSSSTSTTSSSTSTTSSSTSTSSSSTSTTFSSMSTTSTSTKTAIRSTSTVPATASSDSPVDLASSSATPSQSPHSPSSGLSSEAQAGIGVGVALGIATAVLLAIFIYTMRQRAAARNGRLLATKCKEMARNESKAAELDVVGSETQELDGLNARHEVDGNSRRTGVGQYELSGRVESFGWMHGRL